MPNPLDMQFACPMLENTACIVFRVSDTNTMQAAVCGLICIVWISPDSLLSSVLWLPDRIRPTILVRIGG